MADSRARHMTAALAASTAVAQGRILPSTLHSCKHYWWPGPSSKRTTASWAAALLATDSAADRPTGDTADTEPLLAVVVHLVQQSEPHLAYSPDK